MRLSEAGSNRLASDIAALDLEGCSQAVWRLGLTSDSRNAKEEGGAALMRPEVESAGGGRHGARAAVFLSHMPVPVICVLSLTDPRLQQCTAKQTQAASWVRLSTSVEKQFMPRPQQ